jgi:hypothetical protein
MNRKKRPALFLVFTALLVTVCRCGPDPFSPNNTSPIKLKDGSSLGSCKLFQEFANIGAGPDEATSTMVWDCSLTCPDGSQVEFQLDGDQSVPAFYNDPYLEAGDTTGFLTQYCSPEAMAAADTPEAPTEEPSPTPTDTPQEQVIIIPPQNLLILPPVLAGSVTACDTGLGFINFPLADPQPDLSGKSVSVFLNGNKVNCRLAGSQSQLLGCSLPTGTTFPVIVSASIDDVEVNNFPFNGAICTNTVPTRETEDDSEPTATSQPPVDCEVNPNPYEC